MRDSKKSVFNHLDDFVLNFDFGYKSRIRNMSVPAFCENYKIKYFQPRPICTKFYVKINL